MTPILQGMTILIVEDDYYLASDVTALLERAGARVLGPHGDFDAAARVSERLDGAVLDINVGSGPSFEFARALREQGVPFIFVTGYDRAIIPPEFADVERIEKPARDDELVDALARCCAEPVRR